MTTLQPGDEVFGIAEGSFAEYACARADKLAPRPDSLTFGQAAVAVSALTAPQGLRDHAQVQPGHKVLIIGASGGVGSFAVQIAKAFGAEVTVVSRWSSRSTIPIATSTALRLRSESSRSSRSRSSSARSAVTAPAGFINRVGVYLALMEDRYPSTDDQQAVHLDFAHPDAREGLNRWLPLVKWFLALPHYIVLFVLDIAAIVVVIVSWVRHRVHGPVPARSVQLRPGGDPLAQPSRRVRLHPGHRSLPAVQARRLSGRIRRGLRSQRALGGAPGRGFSL